MIGGKMKVAKLMTRKLFTVSPEDTVETAVQYLRQRGVRHLLVLDQDELVGILSDRDFKRALQPEQPGGKGSGAGRSLFPSRADTGPGNHDEGSAHY